MRAVAAAFAACMLVVGLVCAAGPAWRPHAWADQSTLELETVAAGGAEHWFPVWPS